MENQTYETELAKFRLLNKLILPNGAHFCLIQLLDDAPAYWAHALRFLALRDGDSLATGIVEDMYPTVADESVTEMLEAIGIKNDLPENVEVEVTYHSRPWNGLLSMMVGGLPGEERSGHEIGTHFVRDMVRAMGKYRAEHQEAES